MQMKIGFFPKRLRNKLVYFTSSNNNSNINKDGVIRNITEIIYFQKLKKNTHKVGY